ncbi:MAG: hypothetical protein QG577_438 [Thermodesulfobacteriota bacterium]|nr:hypothetical protein [Thermodesulfobacteriota bacterium]
MNTTGMLGIIRGLACQEKSKIIDLLLFHINLSIEKEKILWLPIIIICFHILFNLPCMGGLCHVLGELNFPCNHIL